MTRAEQISEYANSFNGKGMESEELKEIIRLAIIDGAKWADNHPIKPSLPSNIDEAAEEQYPDFSNSIASKAAVDSMRDAFKAGAEWMAGQGVSWEDIMTYYDGFLLYGKDERAFTMEENFNEGDKVIVQIRKK